jgi:hypothetical protein
MYLNHQHLNGDYHLTEKRGLDAETFTFSGKEWDLYPEDNMNRVQAHRSRSHTDDFDEESSLNQKVA